MSASRKLLQTGVIGCGKIVEEVHLPVLAGLSGVQVAALADPDPVRLGAVRKFAPGATTYRSGLELLEHPGLECVVIAAPSQFHAALASEALRRGLHVYIEKPVGITIEEGAALVAAWERSGLVGMAGFNYRFHPLFQSARKLLREGAVGKPLAVSSVFVTSLAVQGQWRATRSSGGGVLLDLASHHVDMIHFLFDDSVADVRAQTFSAHAEAATGALQMRMQSGLLISSSFSYGTVDVDRFEIYGDRGLLRVDRYLSSQCQVIPAGNQKARLRQVSASLDFLWRPGALLQKRKAPGHDPSYAVAMQAFVNAVRSKGPGEPNVADGYRALSVIAAAEKSARSGSAVSAFAGENRA